MILASLRSFRKWNVSGARATVAPVRVPNTHSGTKTDGRGWGGNPTGDKIRIGRSAAGATAPARAPSFFWWWWNLPIAVGHTLYVLALSLCFVELLLAGYRKIPLTCPVPGFRDNFLLLCLIHFFGFECFTRLGAGAEHWMLAEPVRFLLVPGSMLAAWLWNRQRLKVAQEAGELEKGLTFENAPLRGIERLNLSDSS